MSLVPIDGGRNAELAGTTAKNLRALADAVEAGTAKDIVAICVENGALRFDCSTSVLNAITMSALLHDWTISRMRK